ncbi:MAG: sensor domain-containing diguanylate cyclase [Vicinamibacterales bacterium]
MRADLLRLHPDTMFSLVERKRMLDAAWVVCLVALLLAVAVPWFFSVLDIDLARAALFVFVCAVGYLVIGSLTDRLTNQMAMATAMRIMPFLSVILMGPLWHLVGGLSNPVFLAAFVLPVVVSGIMMLGWHAHATALLSAVVAFTVALVESPDLRWYVAGGQPTIWAMLDGLSRLLPAGADLFPEVHTSPAYQLTMLATFAVTQCLVAFMTTPLAALLLRLDGRLQASNQMLSEVQGLFHAVLRAEPEPGAILYADSWQFVQASDSFFLRMQLRPSQMAGRTLFDVIEFGDQERVRSAFENASGEVPFCAYRVAGEMRIANLIFYRTAHAGISYLYVGWQEITDVYYLHSAFDALDEPLVVVGPHSQLKYSNKAAAELFGAMHLGMDPNAVPGLQKILDEHRRTPRSTEPLRCELGGRPYAVHRLAAPLPDGSGICTILWMHCMEREDALFEQAVRDALTGVYNRRYFDDALASHVERRRRGHELALAFFDLDDFKTINDTAGHAAGDTALLAFVGAMRSQLREADVFARRGGDEFAVLFIDCSTDVAAAAIARVHALVSSQGCVYEGRRLPLSFSAGLAACRPVDSVTDLLERADRAVYAAKEAGKGRCRIET